MTCLFSLVAALADLVLPAECVVCRIPGADACARCAEPLARPPHRAVPDPEPPGLVPVWSVADYDAGVTRLVAAYKEEGRAALAQPLGRALAAGVAAALDATAPDLAGTDVLLVPAPSARAATRRRGRDPAAGLARAAAATLRARGLPVRTVALLAQSRPLQDQAGLHADERARNLAGALAVAPRAAERILGRSRPALVVLVDDVLTTGATLAEAGRALRVAGLAPVGAATVAATVRRVPPARRVPPGRQVGAARPGAGPTTVGSWHPSGSVVASGPFPPEWWAGRG